jgi:hypothetical protein
MVLMLAAPLSLFGCGDDEEFPWWLYSGGSGGGGSGNCDYGTCTDGSTEQDACLAAVNICEATLEGDPLALCIEGSNTDACGPR